MRRIDRDFHARWQIGAFVALYASCAVLHGCGEDVPITSCEDYRIPRARAYQACLKERSCVLSGTEFNYLYSITALAPQCFKESEDVTH